MNALSTQALSLGYASNILAQGLNLTLRPGELTCLLGRNGTGKSTLIRTLAALQAPVSGQLFWRDTSPSTLRPRQRAREAAVVLTHAEPTGALRVGELVALGRYPYTAWHGQTTSHDRTAIAQALEQTACADLAHRVLETLSDGERQRAFIARALAQETCLLFLDEPTAFLDLPGRAHIMLLLRRIARERQLAILLSTHDLALALDAADRFWLLEDNLHFHEGAPEDLILDGTLERTFAHDGIALDPEHGSFRLQTEAIRPIALEAPQGQRRHWLTHALRRQGYIPSPESPLRVRAVDTHWELLSSTGKRVAHSIAELMDFLR